MKRISLMSAVAGVAIAASLVGVAAHQGFASDHDDGETDIKSRALNLTDHYAFKSGTDLTLIMYVNPRSLPGRQYNLSTNARYDLHVSKAASKTAAPTAAEDFVFRFEAGEPDATGAQSVKLTLVKDGADAGSMDGKSTTFGASKAGTIVANTGTVGGIAAKYFVGQRADSFTFDVNRFFQVRTYLAQRFFGGAGGKGDATAMLAPNCRGDGLLAEGTIPDGDGVNLWNPPSCAPDFVKNLNVTAIVLNVPIASLGGGTVFDTWSTISVGE